MQPSLWNGLPYCKWSLVFQKPTNPQGSELMLDSAFAEDKGERADWGTSPEAAFQVNSGSESETWRWGETCGRENTDDWRTGGLINDSRCAPDPKVKELLCARRGSTRTGPKRTPLLPFLPSIYCQSRADPSMVAQGNISQRLGQEQEVCMP